MFDTTKEDLKDILRKVHEGKLQLPDFQRSYVWGDDDVQSLIASIAKGFPVGALLTLETGGEVRFKPRVLEGVPESEVQPEELLLDGQQRMTSLYQAMFSKKPIKTRTQKGTIVERFYYLDIELAASESANIEEAIIGVPADRIVRKNFGRDIDLDLSNPEAEYERDLFPVNQVFDHTDWYFNWRGYWQPKNPDRFDIETRFFKGVIEQIQRYKMPTIRLDKKNSREAICLVFEKVNVGGKKLDAFELVTAIFAADDFDLREDWMGSTQKSLPGRRKRMVSEPNKRDVLANIASTDFLQSCTLLHTRENRLHKAEEGMKGKELPQVSCKREALLSLPLTAYKKHADNVESGFKEAASFLNEQKIIWKKDVPYPPQIVALASTFSILGNAAQNAAAKEKLARWFWSISLGELYGSSTESKLARDVPEIVEWITQNGVVPRSVEEAIFQKDRLRSLRTRNSAAYKAVHALLMRHGCQDFVSGKAVEIMTFFNDKIDIHHIFPQKWCKDAGIEPSIFNSVINKTPLSKLTNIRIGGDAPSKYLARIEKKDGISSDKLNEILRTHLIEPEHLRNDDFEAFFTARMNALAEMVGTAMGKSVVEEQGANEAEIELEVVSPEEGDEEVDPDATEAA